METVKLNPGSTEDKAHFWRRQFQLEATSGQRKTDWIFGVILPVACVYFDPIVFQGEGLSRGGMFSEYRPFAYTLSFISIMAMIAWLLWGNRLKSFGAVLAGLFTFGAIISFGVGLLLLPLSLAGLMILIGALGFTPLISGVVYLRNAWRAFSSAKPFIGTKAIIPCFAMAFILSVAIPVSINSHIQRDMALMMRGNAEEVRAAGKRLALVNTLVNPIPLVERYNNTVYLEPDGPLIKAALAHAFFEISGKDIDSIKFFD